MFVIALSTSCFCRAKINKNFGPYFKIWSPPLWLL